MGDLVLNFYVGQCWTFVWDNVESYDPQHRNSLQNTRTWQIINLIRTLRGRKGDKALDKIVLCGTGIKAIICKIGTHYHTRTWMIKNLFDLEVVEKEIEIQTIKFCLKGYDPGNRNCKWGKKVSMRLTPREVYPYWTQFYEIQWASHISNEWNFKTKHK